MYITRQWYIDNNYSVQIVYIVMAVLLMMNVLMWVILIAMGICYYRKRAAKRNLERIFQPHLVRIDKL